ncbi:LysR family transcriptional regulator [Thalassospira marina]|uniref:LysR family transcriptional regulator n=1 Tax=Thalassospira marina TaxID=2048283 RepID=A0A2N3KD54_9PROT|nr:LysR family transcriptional regulator [Thalassospira marina]AUG51686.1 LysR family transcriptional regulator [Thalassospira marina]PKR48509.1 LysR family transcriptional regulator [Thalassospira marina]
MLIGNLDGMTVFARVVEEQSFSGASRKLGMSKSAVSKHVTKLEDSLGIRLLNRTTRRLSLTDAGSTFYQHCARVVEEIESAEHALTDLRGTPRGVLRISAPLTFGQRFLPNVIADFMELYPGLKVDIHLADHKVDLVAEGFDMAIRITRLRDSSMIARKLADFHGQMVASPEYLERRGTPKHPNDLVDHDILAYSNLPNPNVWEFDGPDGPLSVRVNPTMWCNNGEFTAVAARRGLGIASQPEFIIAESLHSGELVPILPEYWPRLGGGIYAVYPERRHLPTKVRMFIDYLVERFNSGLATEMRGPCAKVVRPLPEHVLGRADDEEADA